MGAIMTRYDLLIAIAALLVGFCELVYAGIHAHNLKSMTGKLSTRYLGTFPEYLSEIAELLKGAKKRIDICCDFPAYGHFSNVDAFRSYRNVLSQKKIEVGQNNGSPNGRVTEECWRRRPRGC
jgi:hypothetical protein